MTEQAEPSRVYAAPGGKTHLVWHVWGQPQVQCCRWWPHATWTPMPVGTPVTCGACKRSGMARVINRRAAGRSEA